MPRLSSYLMHICLLMNCNLPLWMVHKKMSFFHLLSMPYITDIFDSFWWASFWDIMETLMVSYELVSSGGNHMTDNDYLMRRINNSLKAKVSQKRHAVFVVGLSRRKSKINNILKVQIFQNSYFQGFWGVKVGCMGWADLWRSFKSCKLQAYEMQCHPFKGMTITLVPLLLIPPPDLCHQRSTGLSLNVLHLLARAADSFHVCEEPDEYS